MRPVRQRDAEGFVGLHPLRRDQPRSGLQPHADLLDASFGSCERSDTGVNGVSAEDEVMRYAALGHADVAEFVKRLRASDNMAALALEFLILTGTRSAETING
jgi:hypothetical protein